MSQSVFANITNRRLVKYGLFGIVNVLNRISCIVDILDPVINFSHLRFLWNRFDQVITCKCYSMQMLNRIILEPCSLQLSFYVVAMKL